MSETTYPTCEFWSHYDFTAAAGLLSQAAGVLAGFAFAAITIVVTSNDPPPQRAGFVSGAGCALMGLITTTVLYATNAAARGCALVGGSAAATELLAGVAFGASVYTLLYALADLVSHMAIGKHFKFLVTTLGPPVVVLFVTASLSDYALTFADPPREPPPGEQPHIPPGAQPIVSRTPLEPHWLRTGDEAYSHATSLMSTVVPAVVLGVCLTAFVVAQWLERRHPDQAAKSGTVASRVTRIKEYIPYGSLLLVGLAVFGTINLSALDPRPPIGQPYAFSLVIGLAVVVTAMSILLSFVTESEPSATCTQPSGPGPEAPSVGLNAPAADVPVLCGGREGGLPLEGSADAARTTPPGHREGRSEQGRVGGDENQDPGSA